MSFYGLGIEHQNNRYIFHPIIYKNRQQKGIF